MGLGKHLVSELGLEDSNDTLGRWMAHHVAELITATEEAESKAEKAVIGARTVETILKLWEHRTVLPGQAYPLAQFREILELLSKLTPDANPWHHQARGQRQQSALNIYNDMTHLIDLLLSLEAKPPHFSSERKSKLLGSFLPPEENDVYQALRQLVGLKTDAPEGKKTDGVGDKNDTPVVRQLKRTIARTQADLASLLRELDGKEDDSGDSEADTLISEY
ncbi:MAG: hypothetical protein ACYCOR_19110 [Acidobacteriaceae bacterium]